MATQLRATGHALPRAIAKTLPVAWLLATSVAFAAEPIDLVRVEAQPLAANAARLTRALDLLGAPLSAETIASLDRAAVAGDSLATQTALDPRVAFVIKINPEARVRVERGPADASLQQGAYTPLVVKVINLADSTARLTIASQQAGAVYAGAADNSLTRQQQTHLGLNPNTAGARDRFLDVEMFASPPMTANLSGLAVEYAVALVHSAESGVREATIGFDIGQGTQDLGFRGETPVLFHIRPAVPVRLRVIDHDERPTTARLIFRDRAGHVFPPQAKRLAPDLFFQSQIYRYDGETVWLPPGPMTVEYSRGPEYRVLRRAFDVVETADAAQQALELRLERWIDPSARGYYCGDHHIHGAGCAHYTSPSEGVSPADMFRQVKGEGLNVGCVLTWGPCFDYQRRFFAPVVDDISEPWTLLKYDLEISGFGSAALGHVCLLNLRDQTYPGSDGTKDKGWPTWTTPVLRWAKAQGATTGYAHSAGGLDIDPVAASRRMLAGFDANGDKALDPAEYAAALAIAPFESLDTDRDGALIAAELAAGHQAAAEELPNLAVPEMNGSGAQEIFVSAALGACDFISSMDTRRIAEWNCWYHLMNCGLAVATSGETDFPCMSSTRVGQGRVYVRLGQVDRLDFGQWCQALAEGRSYVSDGYAHALDFEVSANDTAAPATSGDTLRLPRPATVKVRAVVAFAAETPEGVAHGTLPVAAGRAVTGDTVYLHADPSTRTVQGGERLVEVVHNGRAVASRVVPADAREHELTFDVPVDGSGWIAVRQFPQLHTNVVRVLVADQPIRASRASARWCQAAIEQLWTSRGRGIAATERDDARATFDQALEFYRRVEAECRAGS